MYDAALGAAQEPYKERRANAQMRETPEFKRYEDATNIELFYDLFFVANLTTFTNAHEINAITALAAYAGFFCILWFLWVQVSLFDVRFVQDSVLERVGKACQFGVMIGLAIVGPSFNPDAEKQGAFQSLAIILMLSRVVLSLQYALVLYQVWYYKNTRLPLSAIVGANLAAAFVYFCTFLWVFSSTEDGCSLTNDSSFQWIQVRQPTEQRLPCVVCNSDSGNGRQHWSLV